MKKILAIVLVLFVFLSVLFSFQVFSAPYLVGDLDSDGFQTAKDLNLLKKAAGGVSVMEDIRPADINDDDQLTATDVNLMVRFLAGVYVIVQPQEEKVFVGDYTVVYPENATRYEIYAAEILCDYVEDNCNIELTCVDDSAPEVEYEILIGNTNRKESSITSELYDHQYLIMNEGSKIILHGKDYMIGGAVAALTYENLTENNIIVENIPLKEVVVDYTPVEADSVILMIGDGMGYNQIKFTDFYMNNSAAMQSYNYDGFIANSFPNRGEVTTYCVSDVKPNATYDKVVTDSAAAATALSTGWKTQQKMLGINAMGNEVKNIREVAAELGLKTAVISTEVSTGATPAGFTVHHSSRSDAEELLAQQLALLENGEITYLKGDIQDNLLSDTKECLDVISTDSEGFFVMIEEAYIDKACHKLGSDYTRDQLAHYVYRFDSAIEYAATFAASRPGTVLIVTADHETGNLNMYGALGNSGEHTGQNVPVFALGYGTEIFNETVVDNTDIADFMASVYGLNAFGGTVYVNE